MSLDFLDTTLDTFKSRSRYVIDGIVIYHNKKYPVNTNKNPKHAFAYKKNYSVSTEVVDVVWDTTRYGVYKPRVQIKEVVINGSHINFASGFNAKYISDNKIGPGTKVSVTLSGEVIPFITNVIKSTTAKMPEEEYEWNKTEVDIVVKKQTDGMVAKLLENFVKTLKMKSVSLKTVEKITAAGYTTIPELLALTAEDFEDIGFGPKQSVNIYNAIHKIVDGEIEVEKLMAASNIFGFGYAVRKFTMITKARPDVFSMADDEDLREEILEVEGIGEETVDQFVKNLPRFMTFLEENPIFNVEFPRVPSESDSEDEGDGEFKDQKVVFSGFRDEDLKNRIESGGGEVVNTVSGKTTMLIVKENNGSSKIKKAEKLGVTIKLLSEM